MVNFLGALGGLLGGFYQQKAAKAGNKLEKMKGRYNLNQAIRNRKMTEYDAYLAKRQAEEGAAASGTYDPSEPLNVGRQAVGRVEKRGQMAVEGAAEAEHYASKSMSALKKAISNQRRQYYIQQAINLLNTGLGAYSMIPSAQPPASQYPQSLMVGGELPQSNFRMPVPSR